ncbi:hypothetical protein BDW59DRAFT_152625 [Aspergillus cavernicola]|uniref:C2H2 finger domain protein n=1 Tax=Aspergillus cavernicola TaxID=176166 RepID=A0ABR4HPL8_9EURO
MGDHYQYSGFHATFPGPDHLPMTPEVQLYSPDDANALSTMQNAMMGYIPDSAVKGYLPVLPWRYPPPPASGLAHWSPASPYDESIRSISPQTDCQSSRCMSSLSYDDATSCASGFESSPSPSSTYHEPMSMALYEQEPVSATEPAQPMLLNSPVFVAYPIQYASPTSSPSEPPKSPRKAPSTRKESTRNRVQKRSKAPKKTPARPKARIEPATTSKSTPKKSTDRRFECCFSRYGCTSTFPNKNEWKRHVSSQHIQAGFYRCDIGRCSLNNISPRATSQSPSSPSSPSSPCSSSSPSSQPPAILVNDFNRKDLFIQHQRRMHAPWITTKTRKNNVPQEEQNAFESSLEEVSKRCWKQLRLPPTLSQCGFCPMEFRGQNAWKERMEHVARHLDNADPGPEREDVPLREWAVDQGILVAVNGEWRLASLCRK